MSRNIYLSLLLRSKLTSPPGFRRKLNNWAQACHVLVYYEPSVVGPQYNMQWQSVVLRTLNLWMVCLPRFANVAPIVDFQRGAGKIRYGAGWGSSKESAGEQAAISTLQQLGIP